MPEYITISDDLNDRYTVPTHMLIVHSWHGNKKESDEKKTIYVINLETTDEVLHLHYYDAKRRDAILHEIEGVLDTININTAVEIERERKQEEDNKLAPFIKRITDSTSEDELVNIRREIPFYYQETPEAFEMAYTQKLSTFRQNPNG